MGTSRIPRTVASARPRRVARVSWQASPVDDGRHRFRTPRVADEFFPDPRRPLRRYLSRLSPQAPQHRWQAEALAQEAQVRTIPEPLRDSRDPARALRDAFLL